MLIIDFSSASLITRPLLMFQLHNRIWLRMVEWCLLNIGSEAIGLGSPIASGFGCPVAALLDSGSGCPAGVNSSLDEGT